MKQIKNRVVYLIIFFVFNSKTKPKSQKAKKRKKDVFDSVKNLCKGRELIINTFKSRLFPLKSTTGEGLKILTRKQLLLAIAFNIAIEQKIIDSKFLLLIIYLPFAMNLSLFC